MRRRPLADRFWSKVEKTDTCWLWTGATDGHGRGNIADDYNGEKITMLKAHRVSWQLANGPIPPGHQVHHLCRNGLCVRPDHLALMARSEHEQLHGAERRVDHCQRGHPYNEANTRVRSNGTKVCRECDRQRNQQRRNERALALADGLS